MTWENPVAATLLVYFVAVAVGVFLILKFSKNKTRKISTLRLFIQAVAIVAVFMGLVIGPFDQPLWQPLGPAPRGNLIGAQFFGNQFPDGLSVPILACYYPSGRTVTCALWQLQAYIFPFWNYSRGYTVLYSTSGLEKLAIVMGSLIAMSVVLGRFFCGWICPFGLYMDVLTRIRKAFGKRHLSFSEKTNTALGQLRYIIIAVFLILSVIFASYAIFGTQLIPGTRPGGPQGTEAGLVGSLNEPFCLVCPMRPLCVLIECGLGYMKWSYVSQITYGPLYISGFYVTSLNLAILIAITILALAYRRFWCRICPLGGMIALFNRYPPFKWVSGVRLHKVEEKCTKCGICVNLCPSKAISINPSNPKK